MSINKRRLIERAGSALFLLLILVFAGILIGPLYERWRAEQLLALLQQTKVGVTTEAEFRSAATKPLRFDWVRTPEDDRKTYKDFFTIRRQYIWLEKARTMEHLHRRGRFR